MADTPDSSERSPESAPDWLQRVLSSARLGTWEWNPTTGRVTWSAQVADIFGISTFEGTYADWSKVVHPADLELTKAALNRALIHGESREVRLEYRVLTSSRKVVWVEARGEVERQPDGTAERVIGIVQEVTSRKELEHQLAQSQRLETVGRLAGGVAHDFNNLLTAIFGAISLAKSHAPEAAQADLQTALDAAERASALTQRLLVFSRQRASDVRLLDLNEIVENSQKMLSRVLRDDIRLRAALAPRKLAVRADSAQLEQVLVNLVINAAEAMPGGGTVEIATSAQVIRSGHQKLAPGRYFVLSVRDTGVGMTAEQRQHLFEPFFTTKPHGVGLGLATSLGIVERLGGTCAIQSELGAGTTIDIFLPEARPERKVTPNPGPAVAPVGKILVVEDDRVVRDTTVRLLVRAGFKVASADDLASALSALSGPERIDLVVTDVIMPDRSGPDLIRRLREDRPDLLALFVSGYAGEALHEHGLSQEDAFLQKPYMPDVLIGRIQELLARRSE
jgi:two-component system, cell cycle sensor histidine kinase and response regulator CckA